MKSQIGARYIAKQRHEKESVLLNHYHTKESIIVSKNVRKRVKGDK